jgi:transposase
MEGRPGRRRQPADKGRPQSRSVGCAGGKTASQSYTRKGPAVSKHTTETFSIKYVGLDVHKETIAVAVADSGTALPRGLGIISNDTAALGVLVKKLGRPSELRVCYEAGPCGYVIQRFLEQLQIDCVIVAPSLIPRKPGDRVKTDRRDASKLARLLRSGELTPTWIPDEQHEALRDLVRAREDAIEDQLRSRNRLTKFLLRLGVKPPDGVKAWSAPYKKWLDALAWDRPVQQVVFAEYRQSLEEIQQRVTRFEREIQTLAPNTAHGPTIAALQAMRGVKLITAATIVSELGDMSRFENPRQLMAYAGMVPSESSSGRNVRRGSITKTGNAHLRRVIVETAWHYRHAPGVSGDLRKRQREVPAPACTIAWNAQQRLNKRYRHLLIRGKTKHQTVVAIGRELLGFIWAIASVVRVTSPQPAAA